MRILVATVTVLALVLGAMPTQSADAIEPITVNLLACHKNGHVTHVPGRAPVVLGGIGWVAQTRGLISDFLRAEQTSFFANGSLIPAGSDAALWGAPVRYHFEYGGTYPGLTVIDRVPGDEWATWWSYPTTAPAPGTSVTYRIAVITTRPLIDLIGFDGNGPYVLRDGEITNFARCMVVAD